MNNPPIIIEVNSEPWSAFRNVRNSWLITVPAGQPQIAASHSQHLIEPLSSREIEVLSLIAAGLTNQEIGQRLSIALGTVKRHTANINGKLNVHTRTQAVAAARSLCIID